MSNKESLRKLVVLTAIESHLSSEIAAIKADLGKDIGRGSMVAFVDPDDPTSPEVATFAMSKPRQGKPRIVDEQAAMLWLLDEFGSDEGLVQVVLSEQGRKSALAAHAAGKDVPGIETPEAGKPVASLKFAPGIKEQMVAGVAVAASLDGVELLPLPGITHHDDASA